MKRPNGGHVDVAVRRLAPIFEASRNLPVHFHLALSNMDDQPDTDGRVPAAEPPDERIMPTPVRNGPPKPRPARQRDKRRGDRSRSGRPRGNGAKPTPVRALGGSNGGPSNGNADVARADIAETVVERDDGPWVARVLGRSGGHARSGAVPLLALGFWEGDRAKGPAALEVVVVARRLADLAPERLLAILAEARPPGTASPAANPATMGTGRPVPPHEGRMSRRPPRP